MDFTPEFTFQLLLNKTRNWAHSRQDKWLELNNHLSLLPRHEPYDSTVPPVSYLILSLSWLLGHLGFKFQELMISQTPITIKNLGDLRCRETRKIDEVDLE